MSETEGAPAQAAPEAKDRRAFWGTCKLCKYTWKVFDLPMDMMESSRRLKRARCPICDAASKDIAMATEAEILAAEKAQAMADISA